MIHKVLPFGSGSTNPAIYLFNSSDRSVCPKLLFGDPELTWSVIKTCPHKQKYTSLVLSFSELIEEKILRKIIADYEDVAFSGIDPNEISRFWVLHTDKGRTEAHGIIANTVLSTGKRWAHYYDKTDRVLFENWQELTNLRNGFSSPKDLERTRLNSVPPKNIPRDKRRIYEEVDTHVCNLITDGTIDDRDEIIGSVRALGYEVTPSKNFIGIRPLGTQQKQIRMKGIKYGRGFSYKRTKYVRSEKCSAEKDVRGRIKAYERVFGPALEKRKNYVQKRHRRTGEIAHSIDRRTSISDNFPVGDIENANRQGLKPTKNKNLERDRGDAPSDQIVGPKSLEKDIVRAVSEHPSYGFGPLVLNTFSKNGSDRGLDAQERDDDSRRWGIISTPQRSVRQSRIEWGEDAGSSTKESRPETNFSEIGNEDESPKNLNEGRMRISFGGSHFDFSRSIRRNRESIGRIRRVIGRLSVFVESITGIQKSRNNIKSYPNRVQLLQSEAVRAASTLRAKKSRWLSWGEVGLSNDMRKMETVSDDSRSVRKDIISNLWNENLGHAEELQRKQKTVRKSIKFSL